MLTTPLRFVGLGLLLLGACAAPSASVRRPATELPARSLDSVAQELDLTAMAPDAFEKLGAVEIDWTRHDQTHRYRGVPLAAVASTRVATRSGAITVHARDGYHATFSAYELDPEVGPTRAWLVWRVDGAALPAEEGPFRLVVPTDRSGARSVRQLVTLRAWEPGLWTNRVERRPQNDVASPSTRTATSTGAAGIRARAGPPGRAG